MRRSNQKYYPKYKLKLSEVQKNFIYLAYPLSNIAEISRFLKISKFTIKRFVYSSNIKHILDNIKIGDKFDRLTIIEHDHSHNRIKNIWKCKCRCGKIRSVEASALVNGRNRSCGCFRFDLTKCGYITGSFFDDYKQNAKKNKKSFNICKEYVNKIFEKQNQKCALTGLDLIIGQNASIDRIDSSIGYEIGNIQFILRDLNTIKWDIRQDIFIYFCNLVKKPKSLLISYDIIENRKRLGFEGYKNIYKSYYSQIKRTSIINSRKFSVNITMQDMWEKFVDQGGCCALTGISLLLPKSVYGNRLLYTASLDRIDSTKDYSTTNIQWVHKIINKMKNNLEQNKFIELCKLVAQKHPLSKDEISFYEKT